MLQSASYLLPPNEGSDTKRLDLIIVKSCLRFGIRGFKDLKFICIQNFTDLAI